MRKEAVAQTQADEDAREERDVVGHGHKHQAVAGANLHHMERAVQSLPQHHRLWCAAGECTTSGRSRAAKVGQGLRAEAHEDDDEQPEVVLEPCVERPLWQEQHRAGVALEFPHEAGHVHDRAIRAEACVRVVVHPRAQALAQGRCESGGAG